MCGIVYIYKILSWDKPVPLRQAKGPRLPRTNEKTRASGRFDKLLEVVQKSWSLNPGFQSITPSDQVASPANDGDFPFSLFDTDGLWLS